ncbi:hypothetical protein [Flavobacterium sp. '19STA2R22 D10 B1']|uniref:hypothetical protein n=1 Tax=Flavobacterium aerium TaxID=3037261 RepID=UPI00278BC21A|nr:hypothetical protein [Flavobacterium sp. '19STA2R22 D10 B1']
MTEKYKEAAGNLAKAIDVAIDVFKKYQIKDMSQKDINIIIDVYSEYKEYTLNPLPKFSNLKSLSYNIEGVFTFFQEGSGETVDKFWEKIKELGLPYKRENKLAKILKRKKIKNDIEYDFVIDVLVPYQQEKMITEEEVILLNELIGAFENKNRKK